MGGVDRSIAGRFIGEALSRLRGPEGLVAFSSVLGCGIVRAVLSGGPSGVFERGVGTVSAIGLDVLHELADVNPVLLSDAHRKVFLV